MKPLQNQYPSCKSCGKEFNPNAKEGDRKGINDMCIECIYAFHIAPKQSTSIEEAAKDYLKGLYNRSAYEECFIAGAKWMQEQFKQEKK
jgi:hypothetical protein